MSYKENIITDVNIIRLTKSNEARTNINDNKNVGQDKKCSAAPLTKLPFKM